jgi:hypothetical protein
LNELSFTLSWMSISFVLLQNVLALLFQTWADRSRGVFARQHAEFAE